MGSIFKAYDIRGVYPSELNEDLAYKLGKAFVARFKPKKVMLGQDKRQSTPALHAALTRSLVEQGVDIIDIGLTTTPMMYVNAAALPVDAGIMVTASHNPAKFNGFKFVAKGGLPIAGQSGIYDMEKLMGNPFTPAKRQGKVTQVEGKQRYVDKETSAVDTGKIAPYTIAIDTGNGMGGLVASEVFARTHCKIIPLYFEIDCTFPNHEANPLKDDTLKEIKKTIKAKKADLGIALDGDADRIYLLDHTGERVPADLLAAAVMPDILAKSKKGIVLGNVTCSWVLKEEVERLGGAFHECPVGHSLIKEQMRKEKAVFAAEVSGHYFLKDNNFFESPFSIALMALHRMSEEKKSLRELIAPMRRYHSTGELNFEVHDKEGTIRRIESAMTQGAKRISKLDGLKVEFDDYWFNVRPSNTEPLLRLNLEAKSEKTRDLMRDKLVKLVKNG